MKENEKRWIRRTRLLTDDEFICPLCGHVSCRQLPVCPNCHGRPGPAEADSTWIDEYEEMDILFDDES